jgi:hypothetical protein
MSVAKFEMPDGRIARFEVPDGTTPEQAQSLFDQYVQQNPAEFVAPVPSRPEGLPPPRRQTMMDYAGRYAGIAGRGISEAAAPMATGAALGGMVAGPPGVATGAVIGGVAVPLADLATMGYNALLGKQAQLPSEAISALIPGPRAETAGERVLQATAGAAGGTGLTVQAGRVLSKAVAPLGEMLESTRGLRAVGQEATKASVIPSTVATGVGQTVTEATDNPFLGMAAGVFAGGVAGAKPGQYETITPQEVLDRAKKNYDILDQSNFKLGLTSFNRAMVDSVQGLRSAGYDPRIMPKVEVALEQLLSNKPKTVQELMVVRGFLKNAAASADANERRVASRLVDDFDDYVLNAKPNQIVSGSRDDIQAWGEARKAYGQFKRSEIFASMLDNAKFSQSPPETYLRNEITKLAKNPKRMRLFTKDQQEAIRKAADDDSIQSSLRLIAKFTPMTPAAAIFTAVSPFGAYTAAAGMTAKELATRRRFRELQNLRTEMLLGRKPERLAGPFRDVPASTGRAALNMLNPVMMQETQNALME